LGQVESDAQVLSNAIKREARDLERFLTNEARRRDVRTPSRAAWRLAHTPDRCLAVDEALEELRLEELSQLQHPKWRASSAWTASANTLDVRFFVTIQTTADSDCINHLVPDPTGAFKNAFTSDCLSWGNPALSFFLVNVRVISGEPVTAHLTNFAILSRSGKTFTAVDVRAQAQAPEVFWRPRERVRVGQERRRYIVFDSPGLRVRALALEIDDMLFSVAFGPKERLVRPAT
jgi:hypothetical protein